MSEHLFDGGPAFPCEIGGDPVNNQHQTGNYTAMQYGMTLRDWFAATVDIPWNAVLETLRLKGEGAPTVHRMVEFRAVLRYAEAEAMLRMRGQQ